MYHLHFELIAELANLRQICSFHLNTNTITHCADTVVHVTYIQGLIAAQHTDSTQWDGAHGVADLKSVVYSAMHTTHGEPYCG